MYMCMSMCMSMCMCIWVCQYVYMKMHMHIYIIWMYIDCTYFQAVGSKSGPPKKLSWGRLGWPSCHQKEQLAKGCYSCCRQNKEHTESQTAMCWWFKISQKDSNVITILKQLVMWIFRVKPPNSGKHLRTASWTKLAVTKSMPGLCLSI